MLKKYTNALARYYLHFLQDIMAMMIMRQILFSHFHFSINLLTINGKELVSNPTFNSNS